MIMKSNIIAVRFVLVFSTLLLFTTTVNAQEKKVAPTPQQLYSEIYW